MNTKYTLAYSNHTAGGPVDAAEMLKCVQEAVAEGWALTVRECGPVVLELEARPPVEPVTVEREPTVTVDKAALAAIEVFGKDYGYELWSTLAHKFRQLLEPKPAQPIQDGIDENWF